MSSVVISGDTSGAITLAAPAVAGTNTATLPAATGTVMVSGNMPSFSAWLAASQTVSGGVTTKVLFDTELWDTNNNFSSSRFTPTVAGYYQFNMLVNAGAAATRIYCSFYKNGALYQAGADTGVTTNCYAMGISSIIYCNGTTDYVEGYVTMSVGQILSSYATNTWFNGSLIRGA